MTPGYNALDLMAHSPKVRPDSSAGIVARPAAESARRRRPLPAPAFAREILPGCGKGSLVVPISAARSKRKSSTYRYEARGLIRRLPPDHKTIEVQHEDIPGFMPSMMMPFEVRDEKEITGLKLGDAISFRLNVTQRDSWIDRIQKIDAGQLHLPAPPPTISTGV